ncbi:hypothetical protein B0J11DRAFT_174283 [Dendryphion nanum]|uniref:Inhibitor of apoptosis repeat-containing protein n=1 Tax=Dendryphion nanum TaxID=256645 RepID=A0A9P9IXJ2_9PLEO|nr:hypothetical protein B0J11DRAFT_174283 [Dendryphion nanum]
MKVTPACFQARLDTFVAPKSKASRRTSARSKGAKQPQTVGWPLTSPAPQDLAYAGFVWKPTSTSPDNVQCFSCSCQLDGWEESDVPAFEHLTHSPECGFAVNVCIRLRNGDPDRAEKDPMSDELLNARKATFSDMWPLDTEAGFPTVEQMVEAGWYYDPSPDLLDGVTCAYCSLSLDSWDAGDNPFDEHRRRAPECLFFALKELYHPTAIPFTDTSKKTKGKRVSTRSSRASSVTKKAPAKPRASKSTRIKKSAKESSVEPESMLVSEPQSILFPEQEREPEPEPELEPEPPTEPTPELVPAKATRNPRGKKRGSEDSILSTTSRPTRGKKRGSDESMLSAVGRPTRGKKRVSEESLQGTATKKIRSAKKLIQEEIIIRPETPQHDHFSDISSIRPESVFESTPRNLPQTPEKNVEEETRKWDPVDIDEFFNHQHGDATGFISSVMIDAGLDKENVGTDALEAVRAGLTSPEKRMTVEQWVLYNAKRGEEKLRAECERHVSAFEAEGLRALATLDAH